MNIVIFGDIGVGKTTLCRHLSLSLKEKWTCGGILTWKKNDDLFVENIQTGQSIPLAACVRDNTGFSVSRYSFFMSGVDFGKASIRQGSQTDILFIDEIGTMELEENGFNNVLPILKQREEKINILVIRKNILHKYLKRLHSHNKIFEVCIENRDCLLGDILDFITVYSEEIKT